jgi:hypothetical protein
MAVRRSPAPKGAQSRPPSTGHRHPPNRPTATRLPPPSSHCRHRSISPATGSWTSREGRAQSSVMRSHYDKSTLRRVRLRLRAMAVGGTASIMQSADPTDSLLLQPSHLDARRCLAPMGTIRDRSSTRGMQQVISGNRVLVSWGVGRGTRLLSLIRQRPAAFPSHAALRHQPTPVWSTRGANPRPTARRGAHLREPARLVGALPQRRLPASTPRCYGALGGAPARELQEGGARNGAYKGPVLGSVPTALRWGRRVRPGGPATREARG